MHSEAATIKLVHEKLEQAETNMANSFLTACTISSALAGIVQGLKIYTIWDHIKDARNCLIEEKVRAKISKNMAEILKMVSEEANMMKKFDSGSTKTNSKEKQTILYNLELHSLDLIELIDITKDEIGKFFLLF